MAERLLAVKTIVRPISKNNRTVTPEQDPQQPRYAVEEVDEYISAWVNKGYRILNTHYLGENPNAYIFAYVLVMEK